MTVGFRFTITATLQLRSFLDSADISRIQDINRVSMFTWLIGHLPSSEFDVNCEVSLYDKTTGFDCGYGSSVNVG